MPIEVCELCGNKELSIFWRSRSLWLRFFNYGTMTDKEKTALFIGNRDCYQVKEADIERAIINAIEDGIEIFLNGGQGYFDQACASVVHRLKERFPQIKSILVIPYRDFSIFNDSLFDEIVYPFESHTFCITPTRATFRKEIEFSLTGRALLSVTSIVPAALRKHLIMQKDKS